MAGFPDADPGAISTLAGRLRAISTSMAGAALDTEGLRGSVMGSQQWQGSASERWYAVVTERIGDAGLTNEVMGSAATVLSNLAADLEAERRTYDRLSGDLYSARQPVLGGPEPYAVPAPDPSVQQAMDACAARAVGLLEDAARQLLAYAVLAGDIRAVPAANRTPGVPGGANRQAASLQLLATLFGSVVGNRTAGSKFEQAVLQKLGITKNTDVWRPDPPFEGRLTASGLARGTTVDGQGENFLLEIKGTKDLQWRYQLRLQDLQAEQTGNQLWIIKAGPGKADPNVVKAAESNRGGVLYTRDNGKSFTDGQGNPVQVSYDRATNTISVKGYKNEYQPGGGGKAAGADGNLGPAPSPDADAPSAPVDPDIAGASPAAPDAPPVPEMPEDPDIPDIIP